MPFFSFLPMMLFSTVLYVLAAMTHNPPPRVVHVVQPAPVVYQQVYVPQPVFQPSSVVRTPVRFNLIDRTGPVTNHQTIYID